MLSLCFVLMPFGKKTIPSGTTVDFDAVYHDLIAPAISAAGMEPLRADEEVSGGVIHKPMFERLILCDFAVADLTGANANVFYELGLRHGIRPATTVLLFAGNERMAFDVAPLRALPYQLGPDGKPTDVEAACEGLRKLLVVAKSQQGVIFIARATTEACRGVACCRRSRWGGRQTLATKSARSSRSAP